MDYLVDQIPYIPEAWKPSAKRSAMAVIQWSDWFCGLRDPNSILEDNPSFLCNEIIFLLCGFLAFVHAWRHGSRYWYLWIAITIHGINTESLTYLLPDFESFWHGQTMVMLAGRRLPLHIVFTYGIFIYTAAIAVKRLRLPWWAEGCAVGLGVVLIDVPFDIMGVKMLWWTWHDTDPNVFDRTYNVPWTSYYFHAAFASSFTLLLNGSRKLLVRPEYDWRCIGRELICCLIPGCGAFWLGAMQFIPVYHLFHDYFAIHTEICTLSFLGLYLLIVWIADRQAASVPPRAQPVTTKRAQKSKRDDSPVSADSPGYLWWFDELYVLLLIYYGFFIALVWTADPGNVRSTGLHEPIGKCALRQPVQTVSGMVLEKRSFLCTANFDEPYYDFHCVKRVPKFKDGGGPIEWYKICGTPFPNPAEYRFLITLFPLMGLWVYYLLMSSGSIPKIPVLKVKKKAE